MESTSEESTESSLGVISKLSDFLNEPPEEFDNIGQTSLFRTISKEDITEEIKDNAGITESTPNSSLYTVETSFSKAAKENQEVAPKEIKIFLDESDEAPPKKVPSRKPKARARTALKEIQLETVEECSREPKLDETFIIGKAEKSDKTFVIGKEKDMKEGGRPSKKLSDQRKRSLEQEGSTKRTMNFYPALVFSNGLVKKVAFNSETVLTDKADLEKRILGMNQFGVIKKPPVKNKKKIKFPNKLCGDCQLETSIHGEELFGSRHPKCEALAWINGNSQPRKRSKKSSGENKD